ncbi:flavin reductase family protein [Eubacteriales bacterium OttesenSCG-928-N13]|nr:flavin reductase family protein [Eubacteriales bacterium OttesenSCG-928-N13]
MKQISYLDAMALTTERMSNGGVFLSVGGDVPNTMTIGWGAVGYYWKKPVFTVVVRPSRHTYPVLNERKCFTVSVPTGDPLKQQLGFTGTKSGSELNKFDGHGLTAVPAQQVDAPIVKECGLHFECVVRLVQDMTTDQMDPQVEQSAYPTGDLHRMYFGEIVACYRTDEN